MYIENKTKRQWAIYQIHFYNAHEVRLLKILNVPKW